MSYRWIGAALIVFGCGSCGFSIAAHHRHQEQYMQQILSILQFMESELQYHLTPLPELCHRAGNEVSGILRDIFKDLARELDWQCSPDVRCSMSTVLNKCRDLPVCVRRVLVQLGASLGRYDLPGQLQGIQAVKNTCNAELIKLGKDKDSRLRSYQTLGLCTGAAVVILFL